MNSRYQFEELYLHWGPSSSEGGSEHSLDKAFFPAELQLLGFNSILYREAIQLAKVKEYYKKEPF